jgi:hypothetical protein
MEEMRENYEIMIEKDDEQDISLDNEITFWNENVESEDFRKIAGEEECGVFHPEEDQKYASPIGKISAENILTEIATEDKRSQMQTTNEKNHKDSWERNENNSRSGLTKVFTPIDQVNTNASLANDMRDQSKVESTPECELIITTITTICMWGHENCKVESHFKYKWQSKQTNFVQEPDISPDTTTKITTAEEDEQTINSSDKNTKAKTDFSEVKKQWEGVNEEAQTTHSKLACSKSPTKPSINTLIGNKNNTRFDLGGVGVAKTLEMLKGQLNQAGRDANTEKDQRNYELDKMKRLRQAGVTREYLRS